MGTYPPRECGIATFTQDLLHSSQKLLGKTISCKVAAFNVSPLDTYIYPQEVEWNIDQNNKHEHVSLARELNNDPQILGVILQHEYGIYGGEQGENILSFMGRCTKPIIVTLHTVLPHPIDKMKEVTSKIITRADSLIVLTQSSKRILEEIYPSAIGKIYVIPHGIHYSDFSSTKNAKRKLKLQDVTVLSTFGLLSRGKGIENVIKALPSVIKSHPNILYLVLGQTHPVVRRQEGEKYRLELSSLVTSLGLKKYVKFYDQYLDLKDLMEFLEATDIYISTSTNRNQAVSGTLSYALGMGRSVISTDFAQAKEIITRETGRLVPINNPKAISRALIDLLANKQELQQMHRSAYEITRSMVWSNVAHQYVDLLEQTTPPPINLDHLQKMTDSFGLFQFAKLSEPNRNFGYTLDDNARALVACSSLIRQQYPIKGLDELVNIYLNFIDKCQLSDGRFINYLDFSTKKTTLQNSEEDLSDASSRGLWALAELLSNPFLSKRQRNLAKVLFNKALPHCLKFPHLRAKAIVIKALALVKDDSLKGCIKENADSLMLSAKTHSLKNWNWFSDHLEYNNAILPESLYIASLALNDEAYLDTARKTFIFLIGKTFANNMYMPIGNSHWYEKGKKRSNFDQQPEDPSSMILALATAFKITHKQAYRNLANKCFHWFLGNNSLRVRLYNSKTGACYDGLHPKRVNLNEGAESLVSYLLARIAITEFQIP